MDGSQKEGIFRYQQGLAEQVFSLQRKNYVPVKPLEAIPPLGLSWKKLLQDPQQAEHLRDYFSELEKQNTPPAKLAKRYLQESALFVRLLVDCGAAASADDVKKVLKFGDFTVWWLMENVYGEDGSG